MSTIDRHATRVTRRLGFDRQLRARFHADPDAALRAEGLSALQVAAVKAGDAPALQAAGIDTRRLNVAPLGLRLKARTFAVVATALGLVGMAGAPAFAARTYARRFGDRYVRTGARRLRRLEVRQVRRFGARTELRVSTLLVDGCELKCIDLEVMP